VPSRWPASALIPAARALAEGSLLAVVYAALQAADQQISYVGPLELGALLFAGTAWARRSRCTSPGADALGLVGLAFLAGAFCWLLDPHVRAALIDGAPLQALGLHTAGWLAGAVAFWRGESHRTRDDDSLIDDRLMRWAVPGLAVPWLLGYAVAGPEVEPRFAASAFIGTLFFVGAGLTTIGLARLEALRRSTVGYWRNDTSWLLMIVGIALALTVASVPIAALLGLPAGSLIGVMVGPLQTLILIVALITAPAFLLAALLADLLRPILGRNLLEGIQWPSMGFFRGEPVSDLPLIILSVLVGAIFLFEFVAIAIMLWIVFRDRARRRDMVDPAFEERSIVVPEDVPEPVSMPAPPAAPRLAPDADDAAGAYLAALEELASDGRWPRQPDETPAGHLARADAEGLRNPAFRRLAAAYQLARYGTHPVTQREAGRSRARFEMLRAWLRRR
jgi:hypothetical protein